MHTDERRSMSTRSSSMTKSRQRQPSQQQERRQSSTAAPISAQMDESHWITSSMLEASVSIMLNVCGAKHTSTSFQHKPILIPPRLHGSTTSFTINCRIVDQVGNIGNNTTISGFVDLQSSNNNDSANEWKHHHPTSTITLTTTDANLQRNINGDHHMDQYNQFMEHNGRLQRIMELVPCKDSTATWVMAPSP